MAQGISSILSYPLAVRGVAVGALNLCSRRPSAFVGEREQETAFLLACQAAIFLRAHDNRDLSTEAPSIEAMSLGLEEPPSPEGVSLAQAILEESFRDLGKERVSVDEGRGFEPQSADEIKLREMVGHIPWSVSSSGPSKSRIKPVEPAA
jgi:transcriptional regulator with GAF, ATPase, and Fis domain